MLGLNRRWGVMVLAGLAAMAAILAVAGLSPFAGPPPKDDVIWMTSDQPPPMRLKEQAR